jgi:hypothetical protein
MAGAEQGAHSGADTGPGPGLSLSLTLGLDELVFSLQAFGFTSDDTSIGATHQVGSAEKAQGGDGLCQEDLNALDRVHLSAQQVDEAPECAICSEGFTQDQEATRLPCGHHYHHLCARGWLSVHAACPICRSCIEPALAAIKQAPHGGISVVAVYNCTVSNSAGAEVPPHVHSCSCSSDGSRIIHEKVARYNAAQQLL